MSNRNYWKSDNENGCAYQKLAVANAFHYIDTTGEPVVLEGIPWSFIEEYLVNKGLEFDSASIYDEPLKSGELAYFVDIYKDGKCYVTIKGVHGIGSVFISKKDE